MILKDSCSIYHFSWNCLSTHTRTFITHTCLLVHLVAGCSHGVDRKDKGTHWRGRPPPRRTRCSELAGSLKMTHSLLRHAGCPTQLLTDWRGWMRSQWVMMTLVEGDTKVTHTHTKSDAYISSPGSSADSYEIYEQHSVSQPQIKPCVGKICKHWILHYVKH